MKTARVLVADCHLNMLEGVHSLLDTVFETVVMVANERSLIDAVARFAPDVVIVDLSLPVMEGTNVARRLRSRCPTLPIVVLSVHDEPTIANELLRTGLAGVVLKRTVATDLLPAIQEVLQGGSYLSPALRLPPGDRDINTNGGTREPEAKRP